MPTVCGEIMAECTDFNEEEITIKRNQEARTELRNRFLRLMSNLYDKPASFETMSPENTIVEGVFMACNRDFSTIVVKDLKTPLVTLDYARLRIDDLMSFTVKN